MNNRHSVGRPAPSTSHDLKPTAFDTKEKIWTKFPPEGSKYTPPHQSCDFKWKDYCPLVFRSVWQTTLKFHLKIDNFGGNNQGKKIIHSIENNNNNNDCFMFSVKSSDRII